MNEGILAFHLLFVIDRIEPPWLVVEWSPSGEITEIHESMLPSLPQEGQRWTLKIEPNQCTNDDIDHKNPTPWKRMNIHIPSGIRTQNPPPYCFLMDGPN